MKNHTWRNEFPADFDVPAVLTDHPELVDISWHNDVCPSFCRKGDEDSENGIRLWVSHPDPDQQEIPQERYGVYDHQQQLSLYEGDDVQAAITALLEAK